MANLNNTATNQAQDSTNRVFEQEFLPLMGAVKTFAYYLTKDSNDAEDLLQETFMKALRFTDSYTEGTNAKAWLFRICRHAFINEYRKRKKSPQKDNFAEVEACHREDDPENVRYDSFKTENSHDQFGDEVVTALASLSDKYRTVVLLEYEDFTYEEIAAILGIPIGTVRSRLNRARTKLAAALVGYASDRGYGKQDSEDDSKLGSSMAVNPEDDDDS